ncbi:hypothetical protein N9O56_01415 [Rickettsiales bacterium]|nr:hypothetical protein [Rickettsiales bacterium]
MKENSMLLDKFSSPNNHPLLIAKIVHEKISKETHVNDVIRRVQSMRKTIGSLQDEVRILQAIGLLIALQKIEYYRGYLYKGTVVNLTP